MTALDPVYTIGQQIGETVRRHTGGSRAAARARALELLELVRIPSAERRLDAYPHELSGGLRQRAMIAMALSCSPRLLLADEPTTALDATVQVQVLILLRRLQRELGMGMIFVTHDLGVAAEIADRSRSCMPAASSRKGPVAEVLSAPPHPYTQGLLASTVHGQPRDRDIDAIPGSPPDLRRLPPGAASRRAVSMCSRNAAPACLRHAIHRTAAWRAACALPMRRWRPRNDFSPRLARALCRKSGHRLCTAHRAVGQRHIAAMGTEDVARDRQAEAHAARFAAAGRLAAVEWLEHPLQLGRRNARAVVLDLDRQHPIDRRKAAAPARYRHRPPHWTPGWPVPASATAAAPARSDAADLHRPASPPRRGAHRPPRRARCAAAPADPATTPARSFARRVRTPGWRRPSPPAPRGRPASSLAVRHPRRIRRAASAA